MVMPAMISGSRNWSVPILIEVLTLHFENQIERKVLYTMFVLAFFRVDMFSTPYSV